MKLSALWKFGVEILAFAIAGELLASHINERYCRGWGGVVQHRDSCNIFQPHWENQITVNKDRS